jgi:hypothetical protein
VHKGIWLFWLVAAAPVLGACCNFDKDTLAQEAASQPGMLELITGLIERRPPELLLQELETLDAKDPVATLRRTGILAQLGRLDEAWETLEGGAGAPLPDEKRLDHDLLRLKLGLTRMLKAHSPAEAAPLATLLPDLPPDLFGNSIKRLVAWLSDPPPVRANEMLPDMFGLRFAPNKTAITDNSQLADAGLQNARHLLVLLLQFHPAWENPDTYYALSLILGVDGKQSLAHVARLRVHEFLAQGHAFLLDVPADIGDLKPLLYARQMQLGQLVEIRSLDEPQKAECAAEYAHRRAYALAWQAARQEFVDRRLADGRHVREPDFWQGFIPPVLTPRAGAIAPPPQAAPGPEVLPEPPGPPASQPALDMRVVAAAVAAAALVLVLTAVMRRRRGKAAP